MRFWGHSVKIEMEDPEEDILGSNHEENDAGDSLKKKKKSFEGTDVEILGEVSEILGALPSPPISSPSPATSGSRGRSIPVLQSPPPPNF